MNSEPEIPPEKENDAVQTAETVSKSRRRKNARQAAKARKAGKGSVSENSSEPNSEESTVLTLLVERLPATTMVSSTTKKSQKKAKDCKSSDSDRLMSPLKNKCQHEEKNAKALENREQYLLEKTEKFRQQTKKVEEVRQVKAAVIQQIRENLTDKQKRAEEKRQENLTIIKSKAREEALKVDEINFINHEKSQHRLHDVLEKEKKSLSRQQILEEERLRRSDDHKTRESAVEDRRRQQELERAARISEMEEKKRLKIKKVEENLNKLRERAQTKLRDITLKQDAVGRAQLANRELLLMKIRKKTEISTRLHEEHVELKRMRAQILRSPRPGSAGPFGRLNESFQLDRCHSQTGDRSPNKERSIEERIFAQLELDEISVRNEKMGHKLRIRLLKNDHSSWPTARRINMENGDVSQALEILECLKGCPSWSAWVPHLVSSMDLCLDRLARQLAVVCRSKDRRMAEDLKSGSLKVVDILTTAISAVISNESHVSVPEKPLCATYNLFNTLLLCDMFLPLLHTDIFVRIVEHAKFYSENLVLSAQSEAKVPETVFDGCFKAMEKITEQFSRHCGTEETERMTDFLKYFMTCGLIQMMGRYHMLELNQQDGKLCFLRRSFQFTTWISRIILARKKAAEEDPSDARKSVLDSELAVYRDILKSAPVFGSVTLLYDLLRLGRSRPRCLDSVEAEVPEQSYRVAVDIIRMLNCIGSADLPPLQAAFRDLTLSIQLRHICSFLIQHTLTFHQQRSFLLHEVVLLIGQFALLCTEHQDIVHAGHPPTLLQQLARFPVDYLIAQPLQDILIPTLIICCFQNKKNSSILGVEFDKNHLMLYIKNQEFGLSTELSRLKSLAAKCTPKMANIIRNCGDEDFLRFKLANRFPKSLWDQAAQFFYVSASSDEDRNG